MDRPETKGEKAFSTYFQGVYKDRWPFLLAALKAPSAKIAVWNRFVKMRDVDVAPSLDLVPVKLNLGAEPKVALYAASTEQSNLAEVPQPPKDEQGIAAYYIMDLASALAVVTMAIEPQHNVLDLCAAPGGKSVVIAQHLTTMGGQLTANEVDSERCKRLHRTMEEYIPKVAGVVTKISQRDGQQWHNPNYFDRVLIDAPCSAERHLLSQHGGLKDWSEKVMNDRAKIQRTLLLRGFETTKVGGTILYCTCSISPIENDAVVLAALQRTRCGMEKLLISFPERIGEPTPLGGWMILPDKCGGIGPLYLYALQKKSIDRPLSDSSDSDDDESDNEGSDS